MVGNDATVLLIKLHVSAVQLINSQMQATKVSGTKLEILCVYETKFRIAYNTNCMTFTHLFAICLLYICRSAILGMKSLGNVSKDYCNHQSAHYCNNYRGISLLLTSCKILPNILLTRLTLYADKICGDHQCGFQHNKSTNEKMFYIWQILGGEKRV
jgi:hypothetical protein